jgi:hypothetical protein
MRVNVIVNNCSARKPKKMKTLQGVRGELRTVVIDLALSQEQKKEAIDVLEQDARQLSVASAEGMTGGEPTNLQDVLDAKNSLHQLATDIRRR